MYCSIRNYAEQYRKVGVSTTVVDGFFQDKATLITQAVDGDLKRFAHHLERAVQEACSPADSLLRVAVAYVTFGTAPRVVTVFAKDENLVVKHNKISEMF